VVEYSRAESEKNFRGGSFRDLVHFATGYSSPEIIISRGIRSCDTTISASLDEAMNSAESIEELDVICSDVLVASTIGSEVWPL
jgi:hypothetical protein